MRAVNVRVGHDNDAVVPELVGIKFILANATAKRSDNGSHFCRTQHLIEARLFDVQDLPLEGQDCLEFSVSSLFCRTTRRVPLHQIEFAE